MTDNNWEKVGMGEQADAWNFKENKSTSGVYIEKRTNLGPKQSTMYILEQPDGTLVGVWEATALKSKFESVQIGDEVKIEYLGMAKSKGGNNYHNFELFKRTPVKTESEVESAEDDTDDVFNGLPE
jgi:hypothetical protein